MSTWFFNKYRCFGNLPGFKHHEPLDWQDQWICPCDDKCSICGANIAPYDSTNLTKEEALVANELESL